MRPIQTALGSISCGDTHGSTSHKVYINGIPVILLGDLSSGHNGFPPTAAAEASSTVFVNGVGVVRKQDKYVPHSDGDSTHSNRSGTQNTGVFAD
jgi:uncharacterized Zn-binding protein involved in type VI secretion